MHGWYSRVLRSKPRKLGLMEKLNQDRGQSQGQGYYIHDHILRSIKDVRERDLYIQKLFMDIDTWLSEKPGHYMVKNVREMVF